jgi:radical SAM protein with 4Fe4S-binding SPASM domain|tara:strand:- start:2201 stop:3106 length:906 start_codon:yes stop_codon:yes gene_type:complete
MSDIGHNNPPLDPKETIQKNIVRKKPILDRDPQFYQGVPIPSWIELSLIDVCNRVCSFCPKSDDAVAPNTHQKMTMTLINKLVEDLKKINFEGAFCLCGYGEPMLHKEFYEIANKLGEVGGVEVITNGDLINKKTLVKIFESKITKLIISLYDGPEQVIKFKALIKELNIPDDFVILRDRWYSDKIDYGVKLTNRVGTVSVGNQPNVKNYTNTMCFYTAYQVLIDWNGDVFLCPQDWQRRQTMGNIMQSDIFDIWTGPILSKYRKKLLSGDRKLNPCNQCNADGMVYGIKHKDAWNKTFKT